MRPLLGRALRPGPPWAVRPRLPRRCPRARPVAPENSEPRPLAASVPLCLLARAPLSANRWFLCNRASVVFTNVFEGPYLSPRVLFCA